MTQGTLLDEPVTKQKKAAKPKKEPDPRFAHLPKPRELSKIIKFYRENVREHNEAQLFGAIRHLQLLLARGEVTAADVAKAVRNYSESSTPKQFRFTFKRFMCEDMIKQWVEHADPVLRKLEELRENGVAPADATPHQSRFMSYDDEDDQAADPTEWF